MKRILTLFLAVLLALTLFCACGGDGQTVPDVSSSSSSSSEAPGTDTDSGTQTSSEDTSDRDLVKEPSAVSNLAFTCDQRNGKVMVYDLSACTGKNLDRCSVWSYSVGSLGNVGGLKYREDTVFGDVIILISGQNAAMVSYPGKKMLWKTETAGNNGHCIEILPSGDIVTAASTGNTLRLFNTSQLVQDPKAKVTYKEYPLTDAHGVLWDPEYQVLWALGLNELAAYTVTGEGKDVALVKDETRGTSLPSASGHALAADFTDKNYLWLSTGSAVYRFDKTKNRCSTSYDYSVALTRKNVKGFGNFPNGNFCYTYPSGGKGRIWANAFYAEWCTDTIYYFVQLEDGSRKLRACSSDLGAFYKVVPFYGAYQ